MAESVFVVIEGGDCTGKSIQMGFLVSAMKAAGIEAIDTHEPGGTDAGEMIRSVLIGKGSPEMSAQTELFLFLAARSAWIGDVVKPTMGRGVSVVADRSFPSTEAYQGHAGGISIEEIRQMNAIAMGGVVPDLVIIIDIAYETMVERMKARGEGRDRIEDKGPEFHKSVLDGYRQFAEDNTQDNVVLVDGEGSIEDVHRAIVAKVNEHLGLGIEVVPVNR